MPISPSQAPFRVWSPLKARIPPYGLHDAEGSVPCATAFREFFVILQKFPVSESVVGTWGESVRTMIVGLMFN